MGKPFSAGVYALPLVPLSLLVNENKWIIQVFRETRSDVPAITGHGGVRIILCTFFPLVALAVVLLWGEISHSMTQPLYTQPYQGKYGNMAYLGIAALTCAALAALLLI